MTEETIDDVKQAYALLFKAHGKLREERDALLDKVRDYGGRMTDEQSSTLAELDEAIAANDLPSVGTEDARELVKMLRHWYVEGSCAITAAEKITALVSERDELASRVRELEGWRDAVWLAHEHMKLHLPHYTPNHNVFDTLESLLAAAPTEAKPAQDAVECDACHGAGRTGDQYFDSEKTCWKCEGAGAVVRAAISAKEQP